jgi:predicted O-methyltransferase YrrM
MKFDLDRVEQLVDEAMTEPPTWDAWLNDRYMDDVGIVGHTNPYYKLFYLVAQEFKPKFSVELGTYRAVTAGHIAAGNPDGIVYTIDVHRDAADKVHQQCAINMDAHYSNVSYLNGWTWDEHIVFQVAAAAAVHPIDILFIDAWHWYEYAMREWNLYRPMLADEALVVCDDIGDNPGSTIEMERFWDEVRSDYENFRNVGLHSWVPMGFVRYIR